MHGVHAQRARRAACSWKPWARSAGHFLERLGGGGDPYLDDDGDGVFDPGDCDY